MNELLSRLGEIGEKAEYLHQKSQVLVDENRTLKRRVAELEEALSARDEAYQTLSEQHEIIKLARTVEEGGGNERSEELKQKINEYIREIDQCLRLIGD